MKEEKKWIIILKMNFIKKTRKIESMLDIGTINKNHFVRAYERIPLFHDSTNKTNKEMLIKLFKSSPFILINELIPYIASKNIGQVISVDLDTKDFREKEIFPFTALLNASEFSVITYVDERPKIEYFDSEDIDVSYYFKHEIEVQRYEYLSKDIFLKAHFFKMLM
ncbi:hypothetical protein MKY64_14750 [Paenibacillus sp. FSL R7-0210]|uniref:hypothetical protein n=1 Tax=Paenibacillus sp. FSL R7-0210 TaxID=2921676 RepID=UPI0030FCFD2B